MIRWCGLVGLFLFAFNVYSSPKSDSLIQVLVRAIENRDVSVEGRLQRIDKLKDELRAMEEASLERKFSIYNAIYNEYKTFIYDSAFAYAHKLINYSLKGNSKILGWKEN